MHPQEHPKLSLTYLLRKPKIGSAHPPLLILLHGYGSNEAGLFSFADSFPPEFLVISARAPHVLDEEHYAWFALDFSSGAIIHDKMQAEESRLTLKHFIDEVIETFNVDLTRVFLVGFSQGAILSANIALTFPSFIKGIGMLSGKIIEELKPEIKTSPELSKLKIFLAHGTLDRVLPIHFAREAKIFLETLRVDLTYHEYPIPHGISNEEQATLTEWLQASK
jgi:phospholipase/carboxylesterase